MEKTNILKFGEHEQDTIAQIERASQHEAATNAVLCADGHVGYAVPIGGVIAYDDHISPSGVGYDIACGNKAILTDAVSSDIKQNIKSIMDDVWKTLSFGVGLNNGETVDHVLFDDDAWKMSPLKSLKQKATKQLGTIGSGNHYVDIFEDEKERVWVGVHFGSRGLGHGIATHYFKLCGAKDGLFVDPLVLSTNSDIGQEYLTCMEIAGQYAYAGRDWVCSRVANILGAKVVDEVHNHHNFAWKESHFGKDMWVVRKGATPAFPGQKGFVGASMGGNSVILEGVESDTSAKALYSTVHGAGRILSRSRARGKINRKTGEIITQGEVTRKMMMNWVKQAGVELRGAGTDESPHCYKHLGEVLNYHEGTVRILHTLKPLGVAMAGENEVDPYKD